MDERGVPLTAHGTIEGWDGGCRCRDCTHAWYHTCTRCRQRVAPGRTRVDCAPDMPYVLLPFCPSCCPSPARERALRQLSQPPGTAPSQRVDGS